jgi:hypothetical protein
MEYRLSIALFISGHSLLPGKSNSVKENWMSMNNEAAI